MDISISISAFNFAAEGAKSEHEMTELIHKVYRNLISILKTSGRIVIEYYPTELQERKFQLLLKQYPLQGGTLIDNPQTRKEKKYLILSKIA